MHFLLTNDDGIGFKGIMALLDEAASRGHFVTMCAPRDPQSAMSHRITLIDPIFVSEYPVEHENAKAFAVAGSPTDCVRLGYHCLADRPIDGLISGINNGYNAGMAVHYSGTFGAAMEGAMIGIPSVASSIHDRADAEQIKHLAKLTIDAAERICEKRDSLPPYTVLSLNMPNVSPDELKPAVFAPLSVRSYFDKYERRESPRSGVYFWMTTDCEMEQPEEGSDQYYLDRGHVVYTLIGNPIMSDKSVFDSLGII